MLKYGHKEQKTMFKQKNKFDIKKIQQKLESGSKPKKMFVYTFEQQAFVDRDKVQNKSNDAQVEYFCKVLEGCGFSC